MDTRKIRKLIELVKETGIGELEVTSDNETVRIISTQAPAPTTPAQATTAATPQAPAAKPVQKSTESTEQEIPDGHKVKAPMVGTVYLAPQPGSAPFVKVGQRVEVGDTLCLIEAMKMFNKIEADKPGKISARLVDNEQPVEYEQALFIIDTDE